MARGKKKEILTPEERLQAALVPESEQLYKVPGNWCWVRLGAITKIIGGGTPSSKISDYYKNGTIPWLSPADLSGYTDIYISHGNKNITELGFKNSSAQMLPVNTVCLSSRAPIGYVVIAANSLCTNQGFKSFLPSASYIPKYLYWYLKGNKPLLESYASGTTFLELSASKAGLVEFPLAPLTEQQRIVNRIESLFTKLDEAKQKAQDALDSFETRKAAILHKAFTGELTAKWRKEHGVRMESWETHELIECFEIVSGIQKTPARSPRHNPIPYLAVANVYRNKIDLSDIRYFEVTPEEIEKLKLQDKDILIVEGNGSGKEIGRCAMWHNELPLCVHQNHIIRIRNKSPKILPEYVLYYLNSETGKSVMQERAKTTAGLFNLSAGKVKTIPLPFASLDEQIEIVRILDDLLAKEQQAKEAAEKVLEQIDLIKKSILARAFRGELGINDPSEESAVELLRQVLSTSDR